MSEPRKARVATVSLAGCFGCHMAILDIDERLVELMKQVEFDRSPLNDIKHFTRRCDIGIIEGGCCNEENVHVLQDFRKQLRRADRARAMRHHGRASGHAQRHHAFRRPAARMPGRGLYLEPLRAQHHPASFPTIRRCRCCSTRSIPARTWSKIDYQIPGCAPSGDIIYDTLVALLAGKFDGFDRHTIRFD